MTGLGTSAEHPKSQSPSGRDPLPRLYALLAQEEGIEAEVVDAQGITSLGGAPRPLPAAAWSTRDQLLSLREVEPGPSTSSQGPRNFLRPPPASASLLLGLLGDQSLTTEREGSRGQERARIVEHGHPGIQPHSDRPLGWVRSTLQKHAREEEASWGILRPVSLGCSTAEALGESSNF